MAAVSSASHAWFSMFRGGFRNDDRSITFNQGLRLHAMAGAQSCKQGNLRQQKPTAFPAGFF
jgi:hypothetical protein